MLGQDTARKGGLVSSQGYSFDSWPFKRSDQFGNFSFLTLPPIYSPYTRPSETILTNKASIERQIKLWAFQGKLIWWMRIQDERNIIDQRRVALLFWRVYLQVYKCYCPSLEFLLSPNLEMESLYMYGALLSVPVISLICQSYLQYCDIMCVVFVIYLVLKDTQTNSMK